MRDSAGLAPDFPRDIPCGTYCVAGDRRAEMERPQGRRKSVCIESNVLRSPYSVNPLFAYVRYADKPKAVFIRRKLRVSTGKAVFVNLAAAMRDTFIAPFIRSCRDAHISGNYAVWIVPEASIDSEVLQWIFHMSEPETEPARGR